VKLSLNGEGELFSLSTILEDLKINMAQFLDACITAGCDYLKNVRGIGVHKAFQMHLTPSSTDIFDELAKKGASKDYKNNFLMARSVFCHQTVFDPVVCTTVPLNEWTTPPTHEIQQYCGLYPLSNCK
jgi:5'-3' exonuclease